MKPDKTAAIIFTAVNVILIAICIVFYVGMDRKCPEFKFQVSSLTYNESMEQVRLLENIMAYDNKDGDVTDRIVIEKLVENKAESSVVVFYAVSDLAGNVAKISRVFPAEFEMNASLVSAENENTKGSGEEAQTEDAVQTAGSISDNSTEKETGEENFREENKGENAEEENEEDFREQAPQEEETEGENRKAAEAADREAANREAADRESANREAADREAADREAAERENEAAAEARAAESAAAQSSKGEKPVITLKTAEVTTAVGTAPAWVEVIGSLKDDRDGYETLFYNLHVSKYDVNKAGTYKVALTTKDSDGNASDPVTLTIHVK